jgi:hypothetical protein
MAFVVLFDGLLLLLFLNITVGDEKTHSGSIYVYFYSGCWAFFHSYLVCPVIYDKVAK